MGLVLSLFLFFLISVDIYAQGLEDRGATEIRVNDMIDNKQGNQGHGVDTEQNSFYPPHGEGYSPYPSNFMIPKGVCEKNEPVVIINEK